MGKLCLEFVVALNLRFGTSNTTVAIAQGNDGQITLVPIEEEHLTIPSTIFFPAENSFVVFGRKAINALSSISIVKAGNIASIVMIN
jgi:molecular chaperone DnaK (HSP70)